MAWAWPVGCGDGESLQSSRHHRMVDRRVARAVRWASVNGYMAGVQAPGMNIDAFLLPSIGRHRPLVVSVVEADRPSSDGT